MNRRIIGCTLGLVALAVNILPVARADEALPLLRQWSGALDDSHLIQDAPSIIVNETSWNALWQSWKFADELPRVDFTEEIALVATTSGSQMHLTATVDDHGRLAVASVATSDHVPGFRFVIATIKRERILTFDQPTWKWSGSVEDASLMDDAPSMITSKERWERLWESWKFAATCPEIDFSNQIAVITVTRGSRLRLGTRLDDQGDLQVTGLATRDLRPGFRYVIATLLRKGIATVNGEKLPAA